MKKFFTFLMAIPLMAATFTTRAAETALDETDKSFSGWELYTIDAKSKLPDGQAFAAGDHIYVYSTARSDNDKNLQIDFYNATANPDKNTPGFLVGKNNHNEEAYFLFGSDDYKNISESPYELTLTAEWAAGLNADGGKLLIRSDNLHLTKITWERPEAQVEKTVAEVWTGYNEVNTTIFDQNNTVIGTKTEEKTGTVPEDTQDKFQVSVRYMDNVYDVQAWNRLHRAAYLYEEHFTGETTAPASAPSRVKESVIENPHVVPIDGVLMVTSKDAAGSHLDIRVTDDALLDKIMESGLSVRAKMYNARLNGTGTLTGIDDIANDNDKIDFSAPYEVYNLQGQRVSAPSAGSLYIVRQGNKVEKVIIR